MPHVSGRLATASVLAFQVGHQIATHTPLAGRNRRTSPYRPFLGVAFDGPPGLRAPHRRRKARTLPCLGGAQTRAAPLSSGLRCCVGVFRLSALSSPLPRLPCRLQRTCGGQGTRRLQAKTTAPGLLRELSLARDPLFYLPPLPPSQWCLSGGVPPAVFRFVRCGGGQSWNSLWKDMAATMCRKRENTFLTAMCHSHFLPQLRSQRTPERARVRE